MTLKELVDFIRANPGKYNYASAGTGSSVHLIGEQFRLSLGLDLVHVPFLEVVQRPHRSSLATLQSPSLRWLLPCNILTKASCARSL